MESVFTPFDKIDGKSLYDTQTDTTTGNSLLADATQGQLRIAKILSEAIPALSYATGSNPLIGTSWNGKNIDMKSMQENDWPEKRKNDKNLRLRWLHNDAWNISYLYVYKAYCDIRKNGGL